MTTSGNYPQTAAGQGTESELQAARAYAATVKRDAVATVEYIADMALSLRDIAAEADQPFLGYLLEMVFQEAHCEAMKLRFAGNKQPCAIQKPQ